MATLFQLYSNLDSLESDIKVIQNLWQEESAILLLGETIAFYQNISMSCQAFTDSDNTNQHKTTQTYYGLQKDINELSISSQKDLEQSNIIKIITDEEWVKLSHKFDSVVTMSV